MSLLHINTLLFAFSKALDCVERELLGVSTNHSKRVALVSGLLCQRHGLSAAETFDMASCAVLHDNALTEYTLRVGRESAKGLKNIEIHCTSGEENASVFPFQGNVRNVILHHHENWDGSGFFRLKGKETSLRAAALRLADNVDFLLHMGEGSIDNLLEKAHAHVRAEREKIYHPELADTFLEICTPDFVAAISNDRINESLRAYLPEMPANLGQDEILNVCELFARITDAKSPHTAYHCRGMAEKTALLATHLGLPRTRITDLMIAANLHDVGKLCTQAAILEKPGRLTSEEYALMRQHVVSTAAILDPIKGLEDVVKWASEHHERMDGSGYPVGLSADDLPFESRLLACVDVYQALRENRPYRMGMTHDEAMHIIDEAAASGKLDADIVDAMHIALAASRG